MNTFTLILFLFLMQTALSQVTQRAILYEGQNMEGQFVTITQLYVPDLAVSGFDNRARSVCLTGTWIFYINRNYNTGASGGVEYVYGNNFCMNFRTVGAFISSVRFAGSPNDYRSESFTLYEEDFFQGEEEYTFTDIPNLNLEGRHKSIIITGTSSWTIFDQPRYAGNSICIYSENSADFKPLFIEDLLKPPNSIPAIPYGKIKSVKKGCD